MATWELTTEYKKSSIERQIWRKGDKVLFREEGYRWGTFRVESDSRPLNDEELRNEDDWYELSSIENGECWEMVDLNDGCWATVEKGVNCTDEDVEEFENAWDENWYEGAEELGWSNDDTEFYYSGPMKLVNLDTGVEYSGLVDPTTIVHTIELPQSTPQTEEDLIAELDTLLASMPDVEEADPELTDWFPVATKPAYKGSYQVLTKESTGWPFPQYVEWTGKKWSTEEIVEQWRGLANKPE